MVVNKPSIKLPKGLLMDGLQSGASGKSQIESFNFRLSSLTKSLVLPKVGIFRMRRRQIELTKLNLADLYMNRLFLASKVSSLVIFNRSKL